MRIGGLQAITLLDFPGKVACTIFTKACNFRCHFCHNPELVLPEMLGTTPDFSLDEFWKFLDERQGFLDAVCISGGEPTMQADLSEFIVALKERGLAFDAGRVSETRWPYRLHEKACTCSAACEAEVLR